MKVLHFCLLAMFFSCTSNVEKGEYTILDPTTFEEKELLLSDYVDEVRFIIFDTTFLFRGFGDYYMDEDNIIIDSTEGIARFTPKGKFLNKIGRIGEGPAEYLDFTSMAVDPIEKKVYVYMMETFRLSTYLFDGTYIGTKQVEHSKRRYWPSSMIYDQGKLYFLFGLNIDSADYPQYEWGTLDTCSGQISLRVATDKVWGRTNSPSSPDSYNNQLLYWNFFNDSIYRLKGNHYEVEYLWAKGDWRFTYEDGSQIFSPLRKGCLRIYTMAETNNYLYIVFYRQGGDLICFYDKKLKKGWRALRITDDMYHTDIRFLWNGYHNLNGREYMSQVIRSEELKEKLYEGGTPEGKRIADQIDEEAGLMLMLFRLKERSE